MNSKRQLQKHHLEPASRSEDAEKGTLLKWQLPLFLLSYFYLRILLPLFMYLFPSWGREQALHVGSRGTSWSPKRERQVPRHNQVSKASEREKGQKESTEKRPCPVCEQPWFNPLGPHMWSWAQKGMVTPTNSIPQHNQESIYSLYGFAKAVISSIVLYGDSHPTELEGTYIKTHTGTLSKW